MPRDTSNTKPKFSAGIFTERFQKSAKWAEQALHFTRELDWLGDAKQHPEGSEKRELAEVRDEVDDALNRFCRNLAVIWRVRAETTRCSDLLVDMTCERMGDGSDALHLMRRFHAIDGDETDKDGEVQPETFPDSFAWDTYQRVCALQALAEEFPKHIRHSARQMHGWPMIISRQVDHTDEFQRLAALLELGADYCANHPDPKEGHP